MEECMRKLALWHTRTFSPVMTHEELEPIMITMGFVGLPPSSPSASSSWKVYAYMAKPPNYKYHYDQAEEQSVAPLRPKLPYPKIDGLHLYTYQAFIDAVNFYLEMSDISDLFHIRGMPLYRNVDRSRKWRRMEDDESVFVYREGTLEQTTYHLYHADKSGNEDDSVLIRVKGKSAPITCIVPLKDIIVA
ncbi:hypothetical protein POPTR_009G169400v4 [Populus trichocarpa]|uniref:Uncharacterized protein n=1 Tax=Populus trichocarpa TaxID=3694 RepID=A0ACC0SIN7_POPTR|nr:uncharacterized protein LOC7463356 [Populus trichocarpa]KAI9389109.1 hypothetical protein POPTR_009G169400v4 [Populus trichocarpa]